MPAPGNTPRREVPPRAVNIPAPGGVTFRGGNRPCYDSFALPTIGKKVKEMHMLKRRKLFLLPVLFAAVLGLAACPSQTNIGKITADPDRYMDKEVGLVGRVTDSYGVPFVGGAYELDDGTGKIWIITQRGTPSKGSRVGVKGRVYTGATFRGRNFGTALREEDRRVKTR